MCLQGTPVTHYLPCPVRMTGFNVPIDSDADEEIEFFYVFFWLGNAA